MAGTVTVNVKGKSFQVEVQENGTFYHKKTGFHGESLKKVSDQLAKKLEKDASPKPEIMVEHVNDGRIGIVTGKTDNGYRVRWHGGKTSSVVVYKLRLPMDESAKKLLKQLSDAKEESERIHYETEEAMYKAENALEEFELQFNARERLQQIWSD